jgi:hypothetical protein
MKLEDKVKVVFKNLEGDTAEIEITVEELLNNTTDDFYDLLESSVPCTSASCNNESQNFCDCGLIYEDYVISEVLVEKSKNEEIKISPKMDEFLDKVDTLCYEYGYEIWPTVKGWTGEVNENGEYDTIAILGDEEPVKVLYIDGDGRGK